ncbi:GNAT family N-acetyltransferase [Streptomyces endophyticus]|uniref:GNAT family N-acetyltransferase n=1 Tax=Streptomyces endophyticus TaxID=714166 RepID=A0ABU6FE25_9ACTN|nr:GNAT family N-acetyltransferase [Streptomyces endophyticus]MEB8342224.1 GNAT family N-acetyltransferase [Streptomyces endophyticus]
MSGDTWVRARRSGDLAACAEALRAVHHADGYPTNWPQDPVGWLRGGDVVGAWVGCHGERVVGHVLLTRPDPGDVAPTLAPADTPVAVVGRLFVAPSARGHRLGAALLGRAAREARRHGALAVLDVVATDSAAIALYERLGWRFLAQGQQEWGPGELVTVRCYSAPPEDWPREAGRPRRRRGGHPQGRPRHRAR